MSSRRTTICSIPTGTRVSRAKAADLRTYSLSSGSAQALNSSMPPPASAHKASASRKVGDRTYTAEQIWNWDGNEYDLTLRLTQQRGGDGAIVHEFRTRYYAVELSVLERPLFEAGFVAIARRDEHFFQPLLVAVNAHAR
jgi:hypothetical protein